MVRANDPFHRLFILLPCCTAAEDRLDRFCDLLCYIQDNYNRWSPWPRSMRDPKFDAKNPGLIHGKGLLAILSETIILQHLLLIV